MKLVLLGTGGYHPSNQRQTACLMLPQLGVVLDAGTAMYRARDYLATETLDIFLTHAHLDHIIGLTYLFNIVRDRPTQKVVVHGDREKLEAVQRHMFSELLFPVMPPLEFRPLDGDVMLSDGSRLSWFPLVHPGGSIGYRIDWSDRSMAYATDTTAALDAEYQDKIRGVNVLVHECYFSDGFEDEAKLTGHSCATSVAEVAKAAAVERLVIVHVNPVADHAETTILDSVRTIFPSAELGTDLAEVEF